jgi:hypothetical protein
MSSISSAPLEQSRYSLLDRLVDGGAQVAADEDPILHYIEQRYESRTLTSVMQRSIALGLLVGFLIESTSLAWHVLVVKERQVGTAPSGPVPTVVALLLWSLVTIAAPFVALSYLRGLVHPGGKGLQPTITSVERGFGVGALFGVCCASAAIDTLVGFRGHMKFSLGIAAATTVSCVLLPRLYRGVLFHGPVRRMKFTVTTDSFDPEQADIVELTPGTLKL